jgi:hypothetical protein
MDRKPLLVRCDHQKYMNDLIWAFIVAIGTSVLVGISLGSFRGGMITFGTFSFFLYLATAIIDEL